MEQKHWYFGILLVRCERSSYHGNASLTHMSSKTALWTLCCRNFCRQQAGNRPVRRFEEKISLIPKRQQDFWMAHSAGGLSVSMICAQDVTQGLGWIFSKVVEHSLDLFCFILHVRSDLFCFVFFPRRHCICFVNFITQHHIAKVSLNHLSYFNLLFIIEASALFLNRSFYMYLDTFCLSHRHT